VSLMKRIPRHATCRHTRRNSPVRTAIGIAGIAVFLAVGNGIPGARPARAGLLIHTPDGREVASGAGMGAEFDAVLRDLDRIDRTRSLRDDDVRRYRLIFEAQERGAEAEADTEIAKLQDRSLLGSVLAHRYLRPGRKVPYSDLDEWMRLYADLPEAARIYQLASARQPAGVRPPRDPKGADARLNGSMERLAGFRPNDRDAEPGEPLAANDGAVAPRGRDTWRPNPDLSPARRVDAALDADRPSIALSLLMADDVGGKLDDGSYQTRRDRVTAALYYAGRVDEAAALAARVDGRGAGVSTATRWIAGLAAWRSKDFDEATKRFEAIVATPSSRGWYTAAAAWWAARGHLRRGDQRNATRLLGIAARYPHSFYGLLAARKLGEPPKLDWAVPALTADNLKALTDVDKGARRGLKLLQVGRREAAERELLRVDPKDDRRVEEALIALADRAGLPELALSLGNAVSRTDGGPFDAALYPIPHWRPRDGFSLDRALVYAVMRQESRFDARLVSGAGASGLMQILPATARHVGERNVDIAGDDKSTLFNPATNLEMGQRYLGELISSPEIAGDLILALASYNAGPSNAQRWRKDMARVNDPVLFIESLPFAETRNYVERVLANYWLYRARLGQDMGTLDTIANGGWPEYRGARTQTASARR